MNEFIHSVKLNIKRFCYWSQSISDRLAERRRRIERFCKEYEQRAQLDPQLTQEDVDIAAALGDDALLDRLTLERDRAAALCAQIESEIGPVPRSEHKIGVDRIVNHMICDLDIKGFRWNGLHFKYPLPAIPLKREPSRREREYVEYATGRILSENDYQNEGGPARCAEYGRTR